MSSGVQYTFIHRDPVAVLRSQISSVKNPEPKTKPAYSSEFTNVIDANLNTYLFLAAERYIENNLDSSVTGNSRESDEKQSFTGAF